MPSPASQSNPWSASLSPGGNRPSFTATTDYDRLWRIGEVSRYLGVPRSAVYKMTAARSSNPIPHLKLGRLLRFRKADIDEWLDCWAVSSTNELARARARASFGNR